MPSKPTNNDTINLLLEVGADVRSEMSQRLRIMIVDKSRALSKSMKDEGNVEWYDCNYPNVSEWEYLIDRQGKKQVIDNEIAGFVMVAVAQCAKKWGVSITADDVLNDSREAVEEFVAGEAEDMVGSVLGQIKRRDCPVRPKNQIDDMITLAWGGGVNTASSVWLATPRSYDGFTKTCISLYRSA